jgi:S1-C subfamily serine protease
MTGLDWIIVGAVALLALYGWSQGFVTSALALAGFAAGAWLGIRLGPLLLHEGRRSPWAPVFGLAGALLAGAVLAAGLEGVGARLRAGLRLPGLAAVDGLLGAALAGCLALGVAWVLGAIALQSRSDLRRDVQRSAILRRLNEALPPSGGLLSAIARLDPFPRLDIPGARVPPPRRGAARAMGVRGAEPSVVRILGSACGVGVEGSGWVAAPGLVVTNAHVVAGQTDTRVLARGAAPGLRAQAVAFDPRNDVAILRVGGLDAPALPFAAATPTGTDGAVLGFPLNGPYDVRPARLGPTRGVVAQDAYGGGPVRRAVVALRGTVRSGNSGGPMVDGRGRVLTTIFAATTTGPRGGFGVPNAAVRDALAGARAPVATGPCAN